MGVIELIIAQEEVASHISRYLCNYKKSKNKLTKAYVVTRLELLEADFGIFKANHLDILKMCTTDERKSLAYFKEEKYYSCEEEYLELKTFMNEFLSESLHQVVTTPKNITEVNQPVMLRTKLPPIEIPSYSGNYHEWTSFIDLFKSLIHTNETLSKIQKYHYLRSNLKGEAEALLRQYSLTEANYDKALEVLESRYDNKRLIVHAHITRLINQRKLSAESARGIRELLDTTTECLSTLNNLGVSTSDWDPIVTHLLVTKFDSESHRLWEQQIGNSREIPTIKELFGFMETRFRSLEALNVSSPREGNPRVRTQIKSYKTNTETCCAYCSQDHYVSNCKEFGKLDPEQRREVAREKQLCFNCLVPYHSVRYCRQTTNCRICKRRHHSLLHTEAPVNVNQQTHSTQVDCTEETIDNEEHVSEMIVHKAETKGSQVLLATAMVRVEGRDGRKHRLRALIDQGSQASFITTSVAQLLGLPMIHTYSKITGVDPSMELFSKAMMEFKIYSLHNDTPVIQVNAHVLKTLASILPRNEVSIEFGLNFSTLQLADPSFNKPGGIDLLLGAEIYAQILLDGLQRFGSIIAQNSLIGWLISGRIDSEYPLEQTNVLLMHSQLETDELLQRFWESEEMFGEVRKQTASDIRCEKIFEETHTRTAAGRYVVALPFIQNQTTLGETRHLAVKRLLQMERRFQKDARFYERYRLFMAEYENLNHMERIPKDEVYKPNTCYLPHHGVLREESTTTKLRVVFDGSIETPSGTSLNKQLLIGPSLQHDIRDLFLRWRAHKICLVADIQRMYRQILVRKDDLDFQRIVWRSQPDEPIADYRLCTVTYGTSCAPYLAIKTLRQLACDERVRFPRAASVLESDCYTDDILSGSDTEEDAIDLCKDLIDLLLSGGFVLHKWGSNSLRVLESLPAEDNQSQDTFNISMDSSVKTLGIKWQPKDDNFELSIQIATNSKLTKRSVLSDIARIYDPLGWLSPVVIVAKVFIQKLWALGLGWDEDLPEKYRLEWLTFKDQLNFMPNIQMPRWLGISKTNQRVEVHGFSDASSVAYAGVVYLRVFDSNFGVLVKMVAAKTKVAPVKQISVPRLELCGAVLTARLMHRIKACFNVLEENIYGWTDSTIVLAWLQKHPNCWKTFVGNRVGEIISVTRIRNWHHVDSKDNPADPASRGISPVDLPCHELWWSGPQWLQSGENINVNIEMYETDLEQKISVNTFVEGLRGEDFILNFSNLSRIKRVIAYCLRFVKLCRQCIEVKKSHHSVDVIIDKLPDFLTVSELKNALNVCIRISQNCYFQHDLSQLSKDEDVSKQSPLYFLRPFLDKQGIIRVGGRLANAPIPIDTKHPIVIAGKSHLARLIIDQTHKRTLHGGPLLMLNVIRATFWITNVRSLVKTHVRNCVSCVRNAPKFATQLMGDLPSARVTVSKPFSSSGVDFAGPCLIKSSRLRHAATLKAYIAIFICTATKAIHLELVSELSTPAFIAAFKRFTSRRGHCAHLMSDCGTNFIGANFELVRMLNRAKSSLPSDLIELLASDGTDWLFIPPGSPHFGGLWEAGVRSTKHHLRRVLGDTKLTFEEYTTLLAQIECCLNSRPISALSDSTDDLTALTPGHFLMFGPPTVVPHEDVSEVPMNRLSRWQHVERLLQSFWRRWQQEYLTTLQHRYKWSATERPIKVDDVVLIKNECLPPSKWLLGRVVKTHPGNDGLVRVVTVRCRNRVMKRPITKLCLLPLDTSFLKD